MAFPIIEGEFPGGTISTDQARLDFAAIHGYLARSYWSPGIPREVVERAARGSLCFGAYDADRQIGFARVVTDSATFAYLCDVFVREEFQGQGVGKALMAAVAAHPALQNLRVFMLGTRDAHGLYAPFGFAPHPEPSRIMAILRPDVYGPRSAC